MSTIRDRLRYCGSQVPTLAPGGRREPKTAWRSCRAVFAIGLVGVLVGGCEGSSDARRQHTPNFAMYALANAMPVNFRDVENAELFGAFELAVRDKEIDTCMASDGLPDPPPIMESEGMNNADFPNLGAIKKGQFAGPGIPNPPDPVAHMAPAQATAYRSKDARCLSRSAHVFDEVNSAIATLEDEWYAVLATIDHTKAVRKAIVTFSHCTTAAGFGSANADAYMQLVDRLTVPLIIRDENRVANIRFRRLGVVYARCFAPVETIRERLRRRELPAFTRAHDRAIQLLTTMADALVRRLERKYGIGIPHTVPTES